MDYLLFNLGCYVNGLTGITEINDQVDIKTPESINQNTILNGKHIQPVRTQIAGIWNLGWKFGIWIILRWSFNLTPERLKMRNLISRRQADYKTVAIMLPIDNAKYG